MAKVFALDVPRSPAKEAGCVEVAGCVAGRATEHILCVLRCFVSALQFLLRYEHAASSSERLARFVASGVSQMCPDLLKQSPRCRSLALSILTVARGTSLGPMRLGNTGPFIPTSP